MLSNGRQRHHRSLLQAPNITDMLKQSISRTLSPETMTTSSSGYSTGGSSISTTIVPPLKNLSSSIDQKQQQQQNKTKSKGLHYLLTKLKNLLISPKPKYKHSRTMKSTTSRQISSTDILRKYHQHPNLNDTFSLTLATSNTISLPFTYYQNSPIRQSRTNFEKISAWLNHTEKMTKTEQDSNNVLFIDQSQQQSTSSSSVEINNQAITVVMKKTPTNIKPPKRSSSLVTRITRPIIEQQSQRTISPTSSFSSSILAKGMSERMSPPPSLPKNTGDHQLKSNRRRTIDFSRRRTVTGTNEQNSNKENISIKHQQKSPQDIYRFSPSSSNNNNNNKVEIHIPSTKHTVTKKYYFHSNTPKPNEDLLNNSYGLTLLKQQQQQQQQEPLHQRHSVATVLMISQAPNNISLQKSLNPRTSIQHHTYDSLDDLLCDREVESYFYPTSTSPQSEQIYMNLENPSDYDQSSLSYIHGTLC